MTEPHSLNPCPACPNGTGVVPGHPCTECGASVDPVADKPAPSESVFYVGEMK